MPWGGRIRSNGSGEIRYFQKGKKVVLDPEHLLAAVERSLEDSKKLSLKLGETESAKTGSLIKHQLINAQEGLRKLVLKAVQMCDERSSGTSRGNSWTSSTSRL